MEGALLLAIAELLLKYGPNATLRVIRAWAVENPTYADIQGLKDMKPAEEYFEDSTGQSASRPEGAGE